MGRSNIREQTSLCVAQGMLHGTLGHCQPAQAPTMCLPQPAATIRYSTALPTPATRGCGAINSKQVAHRTPCN